LTLPRWLVGAAVALFVTTASAETKIGVVDVQRALLQTEEGLKAAAALQSFTKKRQGELDGWQDALQKEQDDLRKQANVLSRRAFQRRTEHWQRRMLEVQTKFIQYNKELATKQQELTGPIMQKMFNVIRRAATRKGFDIIADKAAVPYARADLELTDMVVQMYNSGGDAGGDDEGEKKKEGSP
jgi:outer membrane protein